MKPSGSKRPLPSPYPRERRSGGMTALNMPFHVVWSPPPPNPSTGALATGSFSGTWKVIQDIATPGYSAKRKAALWINNPMALTYMTTTPCYSSTTTSNIPSGTHPFTRVTRTWSGDALSYRLGAPLIAAPFTNLHDLGYQDIVSITTMEANATIQCINRIASPTSQSLVTALELPKTVEHLANTVKRVAEIRRTLQKGDLSGFARMFGKPPKNYPKYPKSIVLWDNHGESPVISRVGKTKRKWSQVPLTDKRLTMLDSTSRTWLEYRYGWSPLVMDIVDTMKALDTEIVDLLRNQRRVGKTAFKATAKEEASRQSSTDNPINDVDGGSGIWRLDIDQQVNVSAYAYYGYNTSGLTSRFNDFGAFDVPRAIWELVPFSFIVDWFTPIGDWLGALTPKIGVEIYASGTVTESAKTVTRTLTGYTPTSAGPNSWPSSPVAVGTSDGVYEFQKRRKVPLVVPTFPPSKIKLGLTRLADAAALLKGMR